MGQFDLSQLKNLIKNGERIIVLEEGEPQIVAMSFAEYEKLLEKEKGRKRPNPKSEDPADEEFYGESPETDFIIPESRGTEHLQMRTAGANEPSGLPLRLDDIHLEDLPI